VQRTLKWDEFPNGRWGDSKSPAFGAGFEDEESLGGFVSYTKRFKSINLDEKRKFWGSTCRSLKDLSKIFVDYLSEKIKKFPFSEGAISLETSDLTEILIKMNKNKLLTINSQPQVNAAKSDDPKYGWGPSNGRIYQKAYFELFVHQDILKNLIDFLEKFKSISYQAINFSGKKLQNVDENGVNAVTWGVFPGKEVIQPTVVDH